MMKRVVTFRYVVRTLATAAAIAAALAFAFSGLRIASADAPGNSAPANGDKPAPAPKPKPKTVAKPASSANSAAAAPEKSGAHWGYEGEDGPEHWGDLDPAYGACKTGTAQSPINIRTAKLAITDLDSFHFYYKPTPLDVTDTGHSIQVNFEPGSSTRINNTTYSLVQIHFHRPSEEQINGKSFPMVAHMVHRSEDGNLAVIAVLLTIGKANPLVDAVLANLPKDAGGEKKAEKTLVDPTVLMPPVRNYYTFEGSLTTPPCTEGVTWFVLKSPGTISAAQEQALAKRYPHNARPIQAAHDRKIQSSE
jgi:carbonic anhydrase